MRVADGVVAVAAVFNGEALAVGLGVCQKLNARAASAGLNGFIPSPPKTCLEIAIAKTEPVAMASSFNPDLLYRVFSATSDEMRAQYHHRLAMGGDVRATMSAMSS